MRRLIFQPPYRKSRVTSDIPKIGASCTAGMLALTGMMMIILMSEKQRRLK
jgi:hypothetical protein